MIENSNKLEMKKYARMQKLDVRRCDSGHASYWNIQTMKTFAKARLDALNNIRQFFRLS